MKILLIEDNEIIIKGLEYALKKEKYEVFMAESIKKAKDYLTKSKVDLIILDITLPDGNGFNLYEDFIKSKEIPVIFLTAKDDEDDIVRG